MTHRSFPIHGEDGAVSPFRSLALAAPTSRAILLGVVMASAVIGFHAGDAEDAIRVEPELANLLRFMAALKAVLAGIALIALFWRLSAPVMPARFAAYAAAAGAMTAGPGLIWSLGHVALGALLLHGGLVALVVLLWRDPATAARLNLLIRTRIKRKGV